MLKASVKTVSGRIPALTQLADVPAAPAPLRRVTDQFGPSQPPHPTPAAGQTPSFPGFSSRVLFPGLRLKAFGLKAFCV